VAIEAVRRSGPEEGSGVSEQEGPARSPLPELQIDPAAVERYRAFYTELIGFVPPRIQARTDLLARLDPALLEMQEQIRRHAMYPACFDTKTAQLMLFGMLLMTLADATRLHAIAARRAGATWEELSAVVGLAFLFRGLPAANLGAQIIQEIAQSEA
jgi:alkylhydroperoxidase/carboxymuconolactone decarboxylase family protein YurZ